jgi:hypothetical protein
MILSARASALSRRKCSRAAIHFIGRIVSALSRVIFYLLVHLSEKSLFKSVFTLIFRAIELKFLP